MHGNKITHRCINSDTNVTHYRSHAISTHNAAINYYAKKKLANMLQKATETFRSTAPALPSRKGDKNNLLRFTVHKNLHFKRRKKRQHKLSPNNIAQKLPTDLFIRSSSILPPSVSNIQVRTAKITRFTLLCHT